MMHRLLLLPIAFATLFAVAPVHGQPAQPTTMPAVESPIPPEFIRLREELKGAYNRGDVDGMLKYVHPDVLIVFPDGEVLQGRQALRGYYNKMLKGPSPIVKRYNADPVVDGRKMRGDVDLSWGRMNDDYELTDGTAFALDSRFTVTLVRDPDGPPETGGWLIRSFHSSTDAFDNAVLKIAAKRSFGYGAGAGFIVGVVLAGLATYFLRRRSATK